MALSIHLSLPHEHGGLRDTHQRHQAALTRRSRLTHIPRVKVRHHLCSYHTCVTRNIYRLLLYKPPTLCTSAFFPHNFSVSSYVMIMHTACLGSVQEVKWYYCCFLFTYRSPFSYPFFTLDRCSTNISPTLAKYIGSNHSFDIVNGDVIIPTPISGFAFLCSHESCFLHNPLVSFGPL